MSDPCVLVIDNYACRNTKSEISKYRTHVTYGDQHFVVMYSVYDEILEFFPVSETYVNYGHVLVNEYSHKAMDEVTDWCKAYSTPFFRNVENDNDNAEKEKYKYKILSSIMNSDGVIVSIVESTTRLINDLYSNKSYFLIYSKKIKAKDCFVGIRIIKYTYSPNEAFVNAHLVGNATYIGEEILQQAIYYLNKINARIMYIRYNMNFADYIMNTKMNLDEIKTIEDYNDSECSGDTEANIDEQINNEAKDMLDLFDISFSEPETSDDVNIWFESNLSYSVRCIEIPFKLLMNKYTDEESQNILRQRRLDIWKQSINKNLDSMDIVKKINIPEVQAWLNAKIKVVSTSVCVPSNKQ